MPKATFNGRTFDVDDQNFLVDYETWDESFAVGMAPRLKIERNLDERHWKIIRFIRDYFRDNGVCPLVYETCRANQLTIKSLRGLFPTGYLRGACLLAGITYKNRLINYFGEPSHALRTEIKEEITRIPISRKTYRINVLGFLVDPSEWDEIFAINRAAEFNLKLTDRHWDIINYLRDRFKRDTTVATVYECCENNHIEIGELERLFPMGYHRGAIKLAGLRYIE
nr:TusE/DsrC/DsvC family sulfur relay protein [candidate division Zixibacteria bacterium]